MTPASKRLAQAIRNLSAEFTDTHLDAAELLKVLARVIEGKTIEQAMGSPGDWGYGTPIGDALLALLREPEPATPPVVEWHYIEDKLPEDDGEGVAVLVATTASGQPGEAVFSGGAFLHLGSDIVMAGVYAWAHLPEIPEHRPATPAAKGGA